MTVLVHNPRAGFDYGLGEKFTAGLELRGHEVKALKLGRAKIAGTHVIVRGGEAYLVGAVIEPYQPANLGTNYERGRSIRLLLTKKEIGRLAGLEHGRGLTIIPLSVHTKGGRLKLELAIARGRKKYDKRQVIKRRETEREMRRTLKNE